eukprot:Pgem_evm1s1778
MFRRFVLCRFTLQASDRQWDIIAVEGNIVHWGSNVHAMDVFLRLRHVDVAYHRIRREVQKGTDTFNWVESEFNISDMMTKPLSPQKHSHILSKLYGT